MRAERKPIWKRRWFFPALVLAVLALGEIIMFTCVAVNASRNDDPAPADVMIVLGARVDGDGSPTPMLKRRLDRALGLYEEGYAPAIITCGAQGRDEPMPEADAMKQYLVAQGVPAGQIIAESRSYSTVESLANAKAIMEAEGFDAAMIVSSDYHLWRALTMCRDMGLNATSGAGALNAETLRWRILNCMQETLSWAKYVVTR